jgi:hypothetical protein
MNDTDKARFQRALDLVEWLDARIAQQVEHQLEQRLAREREYWRCHVIDLIAAERERLVALVELQHNKVIELTEANHKEVFDWVQSNLEQSRRQTTEGFDQIKAKLDQFVAPGMRCSDDDGQPPPSTH